VRVSRDGVLQKHSHSSNRQPFAEYPYTYLELQVADGAQRDGDGSLGHVGNELRVLQAVNAVVDALRSERANRAPNILGTALLACGGGAARRTRRRRRRRELDEQASRVQGWLSSGSSSVAGSAAFSY
jgi:hypothetical protein